MTASSTLEAPMGGKPAPVSESERVVLLDVLRACALFGILIVNFSGVPGALLPVVDRIVEDEIFRRFVSDSARPLFAFLFGLGFAVQLLRARERGVSITASYIRRMLALFLIGTVHFVLIWPHDILTAYALTGLFLIPLQHLSPRWLFALVLGMLVLNMEGATTRLQRQDAPERVQATELLQGVTAEQRALISGLELRSEQPGSGSVAAIESLKLRWDRYSGQIAGFTDPAGFLRGDVFLAFLLGLLVGKKRFLQQAMTYRRGLTATLVAAAVVVVASHLYEASGLDWGSRVAYLADLGANAVLTVVYVTGITLLLLREGWIARALQRLQPAGRMALTNYLMQSVVMTALFASYGLHFTDPGTTLMLLFHASFFFLFQVPASHWWLARYRYGPAEWLWRSLTYGTPQPMRIAPPVQVLPEVSVATA